MAFGVHNSTEISLESADMESQPPPPTNSGKGRSGKVCEIPLAVESGNQPAESKEEPIYFRDVAPAIEFCCWVVVLLAPFLRWFNGAAVTDDQFIIQMSLVAIALTSAAGLRIYNWRAGQSQRE